MYKRCSRCGEEKPVTEFHKNKGTYDGLDHRCNPCRAAYIKSRNFEPVMVGTKVCTQCGEEKPVTEFSKQKISSDGRRSLCRSCQASNQKYRNFEPATEGTKVCSVCGEKKHVTEFHKNKTSPDGLDHRCKSCGAARNKEWRANNPEKVSSKEQRRRARLAGAASDWTPRDMAATMEAFGTEACPYCGGELENPHWDHFIPLSKGDDGTVSGNMVLVCASCNLSKGHKMPEDFLPQETYEYVKSILSYLEQARVDVDYRELEMELFR